MGDTYDLEIVLENTLENEDIEEIVELALETYKRLYNQSIRRPNSYNCNKKYINKLAKVFVYISNLFNIYNELNMLKQALNSLIKIQLNSMKEEIDEL